MTTYRFCQTCLSCWMSAQAKTAQVCISDLDCDTVELLLRYCYGCLQELPSDHSQVPRLLYSEAVQRLLPRSQ